MLDAGRVRGWQSVVVVVVVVVVSEGTCVARSASASVKLSGSFSGSSRMGVNHMNLIAGTEDMSTALELPSVLCPSPVIAAARTAANAKGRRRRRERDEEQ